MTSIRELTGLSEEQLAEKLKDMPPEEKQKVAAEGMSEMFAKAEFVNEMIGGLTGGGGQHITVAYLAFKQAEYMMKTRTPNLAANFEKTVKMLDEMADEVWRKRDGQH